MKNEFTPYFKRARESAVYWEERAILDFTERVSERMVAKSVSKSELATRLGVSLPSVTKILSGSNNFTVKTMVKVIRALGGRLRFAVEDNCADAWHTFAAEKAKDVSVATQAPDTSSQPTFEEVTLEKTVNRNGGANAPNYNEELALAA